MDEDQCGEFAYDYVEVRRDFLAWSHSKGTTNGEIDIPADQRHGIGEHGRMLMGQDPYENGEKKEHDHTGIQGDRHAQGIDKKVE